MATRVYSYGARPPITHGEEVDEHFFLANRYRNDLCALKRRRPEQVAELQRRVFPRIVELESAITELDGSIDELRDAIRKGNSERRAKAVTKEQKSAVDILREQRKPMYEKLKAAKSATFGPDGLVELRKSFSKLRERIKAETRKRDVSADSDVIHAAEQVRLAEEAWFSAVPQARGFREGLARIDSQHNLAEKDLRARCGVHFGTYLAVEAAIRAGSPPKFKRYTGGGKVGVQLPPSQKVHDLIEATKGQVAIDGYDPTRDSQHVTTRLRIGSTRDGKKPVPVWTNIPTKLHRPIPEDAKVRWAYLVRRKVGTQHQHHMQLTLDREASRWEKPNMATRGIVAIDVGWRVVEDGLRVAYWMGNDGREGELVLPGNLLANLSRPDEIRSRRDLAFNEVLPMFVDFYKSLPTPPEWMTEKTHKVGEDGVSRFVAHLWKSTGKMASIVIHWRSNRFAGDADSFSRCEAWRRQDKLDLNREAHGRQKAVGWRDEIYKTFAARLRTEYRTLIVEKINWREFQEKPDAENDVGQGVVGYFRAAAVGKLVETLAQSMGETVRRDPKNTTRLHRACGKLSGEANPHMLYHTCTNCLAKFDQDRNAAQNLLGEHLIA